MRDDDLRSIDADDSLVAPDGLLPAQLFDCGHRSRSSERRLMVGILEEALHCFQTHLGSGDPREHALYLDAEDWFASRDPAPFFSFEHICRVLDLDADYVRAGLWRWRDAVRAERSAQHVHQDKAA